MIKIPVFIEECKIICWFDATLSYLIPCIPIKSKLYFPNSHAVVFTEPVSQTLQVPTLLSVSHYFGCSSSSEILCDILWHATL